MSEQPREWIFTFGGGHVHPTTGEPLSRRYVRITGTRLKARARMADLFGAKWAHQYPTTDEAGVERFSLEELLPERWPARALPPRVLAAESPRMLSLTITGPEGMLEAMAKLLRDEGYDVLSPSERAEGVKRGFWRDVDETDAEGHALAALRAMPEAALRSYLLDGTGGLPAVCRAELLARGLEP